MIESANRIATKTVNEMTENVPPVKVRMKNAAAEIDRKIRSAAPRI
jgi:hypothetical protein